MGNNNSSKTPRSIQIKVNSVTGLSVPKPDFKTIDEENGRSKSRVVSVIEEEPDEKEAHQGLNQSDDMVTDQTEPMITSPKADVLCRDFESRNESVAREMRLLSVTPNQAMTPCGGRVSQKYRKNSGNDVILRLKTPEDEVHVHHDAITPEITEKDNEEKMEIVRNESDQDQNGNPKGKELSSLPNVTVLFEKHWTGSSPDDVIPSWIHGITSLANGCVLILDLNNNALKLFDENQEFVHSISVSEECIGISSVYSNEVAITCGHEVVFYFVDKTSFVLQQRCFKLNGQGFGICFSHKNYAVTCDIHKTNGSVRILNERGKQRYVIKSCKVFGDTLKLSKFVEIDPSLDVVYIPDAENGRVISFSFDGRALWHCSIGNEPKAITSLGGFLLVADFRRHQIVQVSVDGRESREFLTEENEIWSPDYVTYNSKTKQLFINTPDSVLIFKVL